MSIFLKIEQERGIVARIYSDFSAFPESVEAHFELNKALILAENAPLTRKEREFLAYETSSYNKNVYCATHHKKAYENFKVNNDESQERFELLSKLANILTTRPEKSALLKPQFLSNGFTEAEWQHAVNIVAYFNYTNRLAFAMNITLEADYEDSCN